jgi:hypothetical protein
MAFLAEIKKNIIEKRIELFLMGQMTARCELEKSMKITLSHPLKSVKLSL